MTVLQFWKPAGAALVTLTLSGCITTVDVTHVDQRHLKTAKGLRYSLPATFLLVQPAPDGTAAYSWLYLPDTDKTYAVVKKSFLSKFTLDVATSNGLLSSVEASSDTTGVAAKMLDASQAIYAAKASAASDKAKAAATTLQTAKAAKDAATLAHDQALAALNIVQSDPKATADDVRAAQIKESDTKLALAQATATYSALPGASADLAQMIPSNQQYGPVLFRVVQDENGGVSLVAVNADALFDTAGGPAAPTAPVAAANYTFTLAPGTKLKAGVAPLKFKVQVDQKISDVDASTSTLVKGALPYPRTMSFAVGADQKSFTVTIREGLESGPYTLTPAIRTTAGGPAKVGGNLKFTVDAH